VARPSNGGRSEPRSDGGGRASGQVELQWQGKTDERRRGWRLRPSRAAAVGVAPAARSSSAACGLGAAAGLALAAGLSCGGVWHEQEQHETEVEGVERLPRGPHQ
jgi:hypothetical protein